MDETPEASGRPLVLIADDEESVRQLVREVLEGAGMRTLVAADGDQVMALAAEHRPSLIILDVMMPEMDGYTALTRLRGHPATREIPVIVLTGQSAPVYRELSEGIGAMAHVTKPFSPKALAATVRQILGPSQP